MQYKIGEKKGARHCVGADVRAARGTSPTSLGWSTLHCFSTALLVGSICPAAASANITRCSSICRLIVSEIPGPLGDLAALIGGGGGGPGRRAPLPHLVVFCYQQGRSVRVEADEVAGTGRWNRCQGPGEGGRGGRRNRCCLLTGRHPGSVVSAAGHVGSEPAYWNINTTLTETMPPSNPFSLADVSKLCLEACKCSHAGHTVPPPPPTP